MRTGSATRLDRNRNSTSGAAEAEKANANNSESTKSKWSLRTFKDYLRSLKNAGETKAARSLDIDGLFE